MNALLNGLMPGTEAVPAVAPTTSAPSPIQKLRYSHEAMVDVVLMQPWISQNELGKIFDRTPGWISRILSSDLFQAALAKRREDIVDPQMRSAVEELQRSLYYRSLDILTQKLDADASQVPDNLALRVAQVMGANMGLSGAKVLSVQETHVHFEQLGKNLVGLLRKGRAEAEEYIDGQATEVRSSSPSQPGPRTEVLPREQVAQAG